MPEAISSANVLRLQSSLDAPSESGYISGILSQEVHAMTTAQRQAIDRFRERARQKGWSRVEILVPAEDTALLRRISELLRGDEVEAARIRSGLGRLAGPSLRELSLKALLQAAPFDETEIVRNREAAREVEL
jgi:hypothetical protein